MKSHQLSGRCSRGETSSGTRRGGLRSRVTSHGPCSRARTPPRTVRGSVNSVYGSRTSWRTSLTPQVIFGGHELTEGAPREPSSAEGRAATAVWRAQRAFALEDLARWLNSDRPDKAEHVVNPPGWVLRKPADWSGHRFPTTQPLPPRARSLIERGVVLHITSGSTSVLWPFSASGQPVQGFEHVVSGARELHLEPTEIAEAMLVTTDADPEQVGEPVMGYPVSRSRPPAKRASSTTTNMTASSGRPVRRPVSAYTVLWRPRSGRVSPRSTWSLSSRRPMTR